MTIYENYINFLAADGLSILWLRETKHNCIYV